LHELVICYSLAGLLRSAVEIEPQGSLIFHGAARVGWDARIEQVLAPDEQRPTPTVVYKAGIHFKVRVHRTASTIVSPGRAVGCAKSRLPGETKKVAFDI
jgi:hypothetical protein